MIGPKRLPVRGVLRFAVGCGVVAVCALVNAAGAFGFQEVPGSPFGLNTVSPVALAFSPSGGLLVTANQTPDTEVSSVSVFTVAADGTLTQMAARRLVQDRTRARLRSVRAGDWSRSQIRQPPTGAATRFRCFRLARAAC